MLEIYARTDVPNTRRSDIGEEQSSWGHIDVRDHILVFDIFYTPKYVPPIIRGIEPDRCIRF